VTNADLIIRKYSKNHFLSIDQFKEVASKLGINLGAYKAADFSAACVED
jgi:hypothetical protein